MSTVLLVEDNEMNLDVMSRCLKRERYVVVPATDGTMALALARSAHPDIILMDLSLPEVDGWEVTRNLKADPATSGIPVIALTAHAMDGDRQSALDAGCDDYASKPVDFPRLLEKIRRLLG